MKANLLYIVALCSGVLYAADDNLNSLLKRNDVIYRSPAERGEDGMPIGNGDIGTMVWTPENEGGIVFQLNKVDVFSGGRDSGISWGGQNVPGCGRLAIKPAQPLHKGYKTFEQRLSLLDGQVRIKADYSNGYYSSTAFVNALRPVLAVTTRDTRPTIKGDMTAALTLWRINPENPGETGPGFLIKDDCVVLAQQFKSQRFFLSYALALGAVGKDIKAIQDEPTTAYLKVGPDENGQAFFFVAAAVSRKPDEDVAAKALEELNRARKDGFNALDKEHLAWWNNFWKKSNTFVQLHSEDGMAEYIENIMCLALYQTASCSRGAYPPKFNGGLWITNLDNRQWGGQYWVWNTETFYYPLFAQNAIELVEPCYKMYWDVLPDCKIAARQRWGVGGAYYPETMAFDGPALLTEKQAQEVRDWQFGKEVTLSPETIKAVDSDGVLAYMKHGRYGHVSHILSSASQVGMMFWRRYAYLRDEQWLRERAYPFMKEAAQFYLEYFKKGEDGLDHIYPTNVHENWFGVRDGICDLAAVRGLFPRLIEASKILGVDAALRPKWQEMLDNLAPYPTSEMPDAQKLVPGYPPGCFAPGLLGDVPGVMNSSDATTFPIYPFEEMGVGVSPPAVLQRARLTCKALQTWKQAMHPSSMGAIAWSRIPILGARLGLRDELKEIMIKHAIASHLYPSGMDFDGSAGIVRSEVASLLSAGVNESLLQSHHGLIQLFPAWPDGWNARFRLLAEGNLFVESEKTGNAVRFVALHANIGGPVTILNPWPGKKVMCVSKDHTAISQGEKITFQTQKGETYLLSAEEKKIKKIPLIAVRPRSEEVKRIGRQVKAWSSNEMYAWTSQLGISAQDILKKQEPAKLPVGPINFAKEGDVFSRFIAGWNGRVSPGQMSWSEKYKGSLCLSTIKGECGEVIALYNRSGREYGADCNFGNIVLEADFIPENTQFFGFMARSHHSHYDYAYLPARLREEWKTWEHSQELYIAHVYFRPDDGDCFIWFRTLGTGSNRDKRVGPFKLKYEEGRPYRLRLSVNNITGKPVRYAILKLDVYGPDNNREPAASGELQVNLTADNMPDEGEVGIYARQYLDKENEVKRLYVNKFAVYPMVK